MEKLFKMLGIGDKVSVSITKNEKLLICVGTNGAKIFDLTDSDGEFVPAVEFYDGESMVNVLAKDEEWQGDAVASIIRTYTK